MDYVRCLLLLRFQKNSHRVFFLSFFIKKRFRVPGSRLVARVKRNFPKGNWEIGNWGRSKYQIFNQGMSATALSGFRRLVRASKKAFRGDAYALKNASVALKAEFEKNKLVADKNELGEILRANDKNE
jgi:hypothetical protein